MTQQEITQWEKENFDRIWKWEIEYGEVDIITFYFTDRTQISINRVK